MRHYGSRARHAFLIKIECMHIHLHVQGRELPDCVSIASNMYSNSQHADYYQLNAILTLGLLCAYYPSCVNFELFLFPFPKGVDFWQY